jgi:hypothetical protein
LECIWFEFTGSVIDGCPFGGIGGAGVMKGTHILAKRVKDYDEHANKMIAVLYEGGEQENSLGGMDRMMIWPLIMGADTLELPSIPKCNEIE